LTSLMLAVGGASDPLDDRTSSLVRLAALIAIRADEPAYQREVRDATNSGATPEQITAVMITIARITGSALMMSAAPKLAMALGYDVEAGLEHVDGL
jgi:4-carboxymuconolactone decarboxylase